MHRLIVGIGLVIGLTAAARAQVDEQAERARIHVKAAIAYYDEGKYEDAVKEMSTAYALKPLADLQYNLAQCYERLNRLDDAANAYETYLNGKTDAPDRKQVRARVENLRQRALAAASGQPPPPPPPIEKVVFKTIVVYKDAPPGRAARWAAYGLWVLAAGGAASGIAFAVLAKQAADDVSNGGNMNDPPLFDGQPRAAQESGKTYPIISGVTFGVGALALAGGIALYLIGNKIDREAAKLTLAPSFGPSGGGLFVMGRF